MLVAWLFAVLIPVVVLIAEQRNAGRVNLLRFSLISIAAIFVVVVGTATAYGRFLDSQLAAFDLDGDGIFSGSEVTPEQEQALFRATDDVSRSLAPFTAAAFALAYVGAICGVIAFSNRQARRRASDV
jgi:sorbitol-specific phosphotransferase system component IIC